MSPDVKIFPSIIAGNVANCEQTVRDVGTWRDGYHCDIMDHHFVPNLTFGPQTVNALRAYTTAPLWVDLLVTTPAVYIEKLNLAPGDTVTIHYESTYPDTVFTRIRKRGWNAGIAIDPETPISEIAPYLDRVDDVTLMSVTPGFSGQTFIEKTYQRIEELTRLLANHAPHCTISIDGGIDSNIVRQLATYRVTAAAVGSAIYHTENPADTARLLMHQADSSTIDTN